MEGCTGWRYVAEEMRNAGIEPHLAEPTETSALRGPKRRAKTDKADAKLQRELLAVGRLPECYIPPSQVLEWRALLELYHDLRAEHTGWAQRVHATCFHQGTTAVGEAGVIRGSRERLESIVAEQLSPVGRLQVNTALSIMDTLAEHLDRLRRRLVATARHVYGARALMDAIYGVGPMTSLALCAWLGGADRFTSSRGCAPGYRYYTDVKERYDANRAALSPARRIVRQAVHILTDLGDDAFTVIAQPAAPTMVAR